MAAPEAAGEAGGPTSHTLFTVRTPTEAQVKALATLREPFPAEVIEHRPDPWCRRCRKLGGAACEFHVRRWCETCQQDVTEAHNDLAYVPHPYAIERLDAADPLWRWDPAAVATTGMPLVDEHGGLWVRLTVAGMTRYGYGLPAALGLHGRKSLVEDAVRNAAREFGMALELWKSRDLHPIADPEPHPAQVFADQLHEPMVSRSTELLTELRADVEAAGHLGWVVESTGKTLGALIDSHLAERERLEERYLAVRMRREDADELRTRARQNWLDAAELEAVLAQAADMGLEREPSIGNDPKSMPLGDALRQQIAGLRQAEQQTGTAGAAYAAGEPEQGQAEQGWQTTDAGATRQEGAA